MILLGHTVNIFESLYDRQIKLTNMSLYIKK